VNRTITSLAAATMCGLAFPTSGAGEKSLVPVNAPEHDPLFIDAATVHRRGASVSFSYVLNVFAAAEGRTVPGGWKSNEVAATIDCAQNTIASTKLIAYIGPKATGPVTGTYTFTAQEQKPERIVPKSTTAYLAAHLCAKNQVP
jgi:hypothetical protein